MANPPDLMEWLVGELTPIFASIGDPNVLAKYVVALLKNKKKPRAELEEDVTSSLFTFLGDDTKGFVSKLFRKLFGDAPVKPAVEEYTPTAPTKFGVTRPRRSRSPPTTLEPVRDRKRKDAGDRGRAHSPKRRREEEKWGNGDYGRRRDGRAGNMAIPPMPIPPMFMPLPPRPCPDFEERGYCMQGDRCPYSHPGRIEVAGDNEDTHYVPKGGMIPFPFPPVYPQGIHPGQAFMQQREAAAAAMGSYNPEESSLSGRNMNNGGGYQQGASTFQDDGYRGRGGRGGRGRGGRGGFRGRGGRVNPSEREGSTLLIKSIPAPLNTCSQLTQYFEKFGSLVNVSIDLRSSSATVQFASQSEALKALRSPEAVLNNRFIKVLWKQGDANNEETVEGGAEAGPNAAGGEKGAELAEESNQKPVIIPKKEDLRIDNTKPGGSSSVEQLKKDYVAKLLEQQKVILQMISKPGLSHDMKTELKSQFAAKEKLIQQTQQELAASDAKKLRMQELQKEYEKLQATAEARGGRGGRGRATRGWRGRGRRGGSTNSFGSVFIDNRTTCVKVDDVPQTMNSEEGVFSHFLQYGRVKSVKMVPPTSAIVTYETRKEGEVAMAEDNTVGGQTMHLSWTSAPPTPAVDTMAEQATGTGKQEEAEPEEEFLDVEEGEEAEESWKN